MIGDKCPQFITDVRRGVNLNLSADPLAMIDFMLHPDKKLLSPTVIVELTFTIDDSVPLMKGLVLTLNQMVPESLEELTKLPIPEQATIQFLLEIVQALKVGWDFEKKVPVKLSRDK